MTKPLSMTPAAVRSRAYRETMKSARDRARAARPIKKPPAPSVRKRVRPMMGTVFQSFGTGGHPTTMRQRIRDLAVAHMIRTSGKDLGYRERQALLKSFDADLAALDEREPVKGHSPWNDRSGHDAGIPTDAAAADSPQEVLHGPFPTVADIKKAEGDGWIGDQTKIDHRSDAVALMMAQRNAPKGYPAVQQPLYSAETQDAAKMRECLAECAKVIADAIVHGAKIISIHGYDTTAPWDKEDLQALNSTNPETWNPVGPGTPLGAWLETAEIVSGPNGTVTNGLNTCMCRILSLGDAPEWIEKHGGRTTVTHSTFAPPTHWRWPAK